jgi:hypothetical protein
MTPHLEASPPAYVPRDPSQTVLYHVVADHLETFLASLDADPDARGLPAYVERELYDYLQCGVLAHGFLRLGCDTCHKELLLAFSCKRRGFCPSCAGRRMAQTAAHLVEQVIPWVPTRQWVVSVPVPLRYWMAASQELTAKVHTIIRTTIGQSCEQGCRPRLEASQPPARVGHLSAAFRECPQSEPAFSLRLSGGGVPRSH